MSYQEIVAVVDADNTLWDTDAVFRDAQLLLLARVEMEVGRSCSMVDRLAFVREYDQALAELHHLHLRYPPQLLVKSIEAGLSGIPPRNAAQNVIAGRQSVSSPLPQARVDLIVFAFIDALSQIPALLPNVAEGVRAAKAAGLRLYVMTEGRIDKQGRSLQQHGLSDFFEGVWELTKDRAQFDRLRTRFAKDRVVVIGDQPDRDIIPAKAAGCSTVLVPSHFKPSWHSSADYQTADYVAKDFLDAVQWCMGPALINEQQRMTRVERS